MIQTTRWYPDTCSCVIEYQWDDTVDPAARTHTVSNVLSACKGHPGTPQQTFSAALATNQAKNIPQTLLGNIGTTLGNLFS